jgi:fatty-acyl-CoA synthase
MKNLAHLGDVLAIHARFHPDRIGAADLERSMTFADWYARSCRLANALHGLGLRKGDRFCVLAYNCMEWLEIYAAAALGGMVAVPINFRLTGPEILHIAQDCGAKAFILQQCLLDRVEEMRPELAIDDAGFIVMGLGRRTAGYRDYGDLIGYASDTRPSVSVEGTDPWTLMYTSGTTGKPKGAVRNHRASAMLSIVTAIEMTLGRRDCALLVMPMCHANSFFFFEAFTYCGAPCMVYSRKSFDPEHLLRTLAGGGATFTSLVPTQYTMMLDLPAGLRRPDRLDAVTKLMISSAPAREETKLAIMDLFRNSGLYELYGSTEAGFVTMLRPEEQLSKPGSVGRECVGSLPIRLLDDDGNEVPAGYPGELYSCNPHTFDGYWGLPAKTKEAFRSEYCSVGDLARRDAEGFLYLVDRKSNMIISGGENIYPSEVESVLCENPMVKEAAVIGVPDTKWGERVHAVVVSRDEAAPTEDEIVEWCRTRMAGHKRPRSVSFIAEGELPRTATGKIQHAVLRKSFARQFARVPENSH